MAGVGTGALLGGVTGAATAKSGHQKATLNGAAIGALVGGIGGYILHKVIEKKESRVRKETLFNLESHGISTGFDGIDLKRFNTFVSSPEVREDYVDTHTTDDGRRLIQGHKVWTIIGNPQFNIGSPRSKERR